MAVVHEPRRWAFRLTLAPVASVYIGLAWSSFLATRRWTIYQYSTGCQCSYWTCIAGWLNGADLPPWARGPAPEHGSVGEREGAGGRRSAVARVKTGTSDWLSRRAKLGPRDCFFSKKHTRQRQNKQTKPVFFWPWCVFSCLGRTDGGMQLLGLAYGG